MISPFGLRISGKGRALLARYIQQNQPHAQFWLVFDVDREGAAIDWSDRNAPAPNITVKNPVNGHAHLLYALNIAVRTAPDASVKALKYAAAVERSLCEKLCAECELQRPDLQKSVPPGMAGDGVARGSLYPR